ncbi:MAG: hypothetical protein KC502_09270 [Myxococcales bacterium]|nr:hypothetical protein [Myxococcales bacterium]
MNPMMFSRLRAAALVGLLTCFTVGCGADDGTDDSNAGTTTDGGVSSDGSASDGTVEDAGGQDAGGQDAGSTDTEGASGDDAASDDAAQTTGDAGTTDGGSVDAGAPAKRPFTAHKIAIAGVWESSFGGNEIIDDTAWATPYGAAKIVKTDNTKRVVFTQNAKDDKYNPSKFNKVVWTAPSKETKDGFEVTTIYQCTVAFGLDSLALAEQNTQTADDSDPAKSGCGKFPWTKLSALETAGEWQTNFKTSETINRQAWGFAWVRGFENGKNVAYTQNPADAKYSPNKWNKLVWTTPKGGKWHYCTVDFGLDSLKAAQESKKTADSSDPAKSGCGGFSWTEMSAK